MERCNMPRRNAPTNRYGSPPRQQTAWAVAGCAAQPGYLSVRHAAVWADVSPRTITRWIKAGLPTYQAGPREKVLVKPSDIDDFLNRKQTDTPDLGAMVDEVVQGLNQGRA